MAETGIIMAWYDPIAAVTDAKKDWGRWNLPTFSTAKMTAGMSAKAQEFAQAAADGIAARANRELHNRASKIVSRVEARAWNKADQLLKPLKALGGNGAADLIGILKGGGPKFDKNLLVRGAGGLSWQDLQQARDLMNAEFLSRKYNFLLEISDLNPDLTAIKQPEKNLHLNKFNLFCRNLSWSPVTLSSEARQIGSAEYNVMRSNGRTELSATFMDDASGSLKSWARAKSNKATVSSNGLWGLPAEYLIKLRILFGVGKDGLADKTYDEECLMFISEVSHELDRSARASLEEVSIKFTQWDGFMLGSSCQNNPQSTAWA